MRNRLYGGVRGRRRKPPPTRSNAAADLSHYHIDAILKNGLHKVSFFFKGIIVLLIY